VGAHASDTVNGFPLADTTGISNDLKTRFFPCFPGAWFDFETVLISGDDAGAGKPFERRVIGCAKTSPPGPVVVVLTLRVMVSPHAEREDYFKAGKENGGSPRLRNEYGRNAALPQGRTFITPGPGRWARRNQILVSLAISNA